MAEPNPPQADDFFRNYGTRSFGSVYDHGSPVPRPPSLFGLNPGAPSGPLEGALQAVMPMVSEYLRTNLGVNGYGFGFGADMNISSAQFSRDFLRQLSDARGQGAAADRSQIEDLLRGVATVIGHQPTGFNDRGMASFAPNIERAIGRMSGDGQAMLPILAAMFPDTVDRLLPRGSMAVAAQSFVTAGRFVVDPTTGRPVSESPGFAAQVLNPLMDAGPEATGGLRAGRLGQTFEQLVKMGFIGSGRGLADLSSPANAVGGGPAGGAAVGGINTNQIREKLQAYAQSISAINDIFAESGRPDAPMGQLVRSLQQLTQGGMNTYDAQSLARITRTMHGASQLSGIGLAGLEELGSGAGALLARYGGHRGMAPHLALFGAAAGQAAADLDFLTPSPEGMSRDEFVAEQMRRRAAGLGSPAGNTIGALLAQARFAPEGSPLKQLAAQLAAGRSSADIAGFGKFDVGAATNADYERLFTASGMQMGAFRDQLMNSFANRAMAVRHPGVQQAADQLQKEEILNPVMSGFNSLMADTRPGQPRPSEAQFREALEAAINQGGFTSDEDFARAIGTRLGLSNPEIGRLTNTLSNSSGAAMMNMSAYNRLRPFGGAAQSEFLRNARTYEHRGDILKALAPLARGGTFANLAAAAVFKGRNPDAADQAVALRALGLVTQEEADAAVGGINAGRNAAGGGILGAIDSLPAVGNLNDVGNPAKPAAGGGAAGPGAVNIRIDKATVNFDRGGGMSISGGGALVAPGGR